MMPLTFRSPLTTPERILVYGGPGTGKSAGLLSVARRCPDAAFHVIDNDYSQSCSRLLETEYTDLDNVTVYRTDPDEWQETIATVDKFRQIVGPNDWAAVDSMTPTWQAVANWYTEEVFGKGVEDYFLQVRLEKEALRTSKDEAKKSLGAFKGWLDYPVINKEYFRKLYNGLLRIEGHVWLTAEGGPISKDDDAEVQDTFAAFGLKPNGQKRLGFVPSTVLMMKKARDGTYKMTTVKDRGRAELEDEEVGDFFTTYMKNVAGWKPTTYG